GGRRARHRRHPARRFAKLTAFSGIVASSFETHRFAMLLDQRPASHVYQDQRAHRPKCGARVMSPRGEIGGKVQKSRYDVTVEKQTRDHQGWLGQNEKESRHEEERQVLEIV